MAMPGFTDFFRCGQGFEHMRPVSKPLRTPVSFPLKIDPRTMVSKSFGAGTTDPSMFPAKVLKLNHYDPAYVCTSSLKLPDMCKVDESVSMDAMRIAAGLSNPFHMTVETHSTVYEQLHQRANDPLDNHAPRQKVRIEGRHHTPSTAASDEDHMEQHNIADGASGQLQPTAAPNSSRRAKRSRRGGRGKGGKTKASILARPCAFEVSSLAMLGDASLAMASRGVPNSDC